MLLYQRDDAVGVEFARLSPHHLPAFVDHQRGQTLDAERIGDLADEAQHRAEKVVRQVQTDAERLRGTAEQSLHEAAQKAKSVAESARRSTTDGLH